MSSAAGAPASAAGAPASAAGAPASAAGAPASAAGAPASAAGAPASAAGAPASAAGAPASAAGVAATAYLEEMITICKNIEAIMTLATKYTIKFLYMECWDKDPNETYKTYLEKLQGQPFTEKAWKKLCGFLHGKFETEKTPDGFDMTASDKLFIIVRSIKNDGRDSNAVLNKVKAVKDIRNELFHEDGLLKDPTKVPEIEAKLIELIEEGCRFNGLSASETDTMKYELYLDMDNCYTPDKCRLNHVIYLILNDGKKLSNSRFQKYRTENLLFKVGRVTRSDVFHSPKVTPYGQNTGTFPYTEILDKDDRVAIVSGIAGAGKTTLLKNIALLFSGSQANIPDFLKGFEVLIHYECQDRTKENLTQVFMEHFTGLFPEPDNETRVMEALQQLHVLFLIDGFDERNRESMNILRELLGKIWHLKSRILITTRPQSSEKLQDFLRRKDATFTECKIMPLSDTEQLEFIERYGRCLPIEAATAEAMRDKFSELNRELQTKFTEPILLLYFCSIFLYTPDKIDKWRSFNDVTRDIFELLKALVKEKLSDIHVSEEEVLIDDLFMIIGQWALKLLACNKVTFTQDEFTDLQRLCREKIKSHDDACEVEASVILDVVLRVEESSKSKTYMFPHKAIQEFVAAFYVNRQLKNPEKTLLDILGVTNLRDGDHNPRPSGVPADKLQARGRHLQGTQDLSLFLEVLLYVVQIISTSVLQRRWPELKELLFEAGVTAAAVMDCVARCCPDHAGTVAELAAMLEDVPWEVHYDNHVAAVIAMLHHVKPQLLWVNMEVFAQKEAQWVEFLEEAGSVELTLWNSRDSGYLSDDLLQYLPESSARLSEFFGYMGQNGAAALATMVRRSQRDITLFMDRMPTVTTMGHCECSPAISENAGGIAASLPEGVEFSGLVLVSSELSDEMLSDEMLSDEELSDEELSDEELSDEMLSDEDLRDLLQRLQDEGIKTSDLREAHVARSTKVWRVVTDRKCAVLDIGDRMSRRAVRVLMVPRDAEVTERAA
ncbi:uncharacterized protein LOC108678234 [Hyalella azteca]|uniref:Uncharacterized protein LOC108678234 n=1 Tax=Hyalella azteca TaxID=294128 RepID=A0A8B7PA73_HYAAZ|nr:uncharacterized protein LOC108678234 [Hyalella azteca]